MTYNPDDMLSWLGFPTNRQYKELPSFISEAAQTEAHRNLFDKPADKVFETDVAHIKRFGTFGLDALIKGVSSEIANVRFFCLKALAEYYNNPLTKEALLNALLDDSPRVCLLACYSLNGKVTEANIPFLVEKINHYHLEHDTTYHIKVLINFNCEASSKALLEITGNEAFKSEHISILKELSSRKHLPAIGAIINKLAEYIGTVDSHPDKTRLQKTVMEFSPEDLAREAESILFSKASINTRLAAINALEVCGLMPNGAALAIPPLAKFLSGLEGKGFVIAGEMELAKLAVISLGKIKSSAALPAVMGAMNIKNGEVHKEVFNAIKQIGDLSAVPFLVSHLKAGPESTSLQALDALDSLKAGFAYPHILPMLLSGSWNVREKACDFMAKFGKLYEAIAWLTLQMRTDARVRVFAVEIITKMRKKAIATGTTATPPSFDGLNLKRFPTSIRTSSSPNKIVQKRPAAAKAVLV